MIEIGYNFLKKDLNKIQKFKNPTLDIDKSRIKKNSNYKIFLNKNQYNNLIENGNIKYKLTDSKKKNEFTKRRWDRFFNSNGSTVCKISSTKSFRNIRIIISRSCSFYSYQ